MPDIAQYAIRNATCELVAGGLRWEAAAAYCDALLGPDGLRLDEWLASGQARVVKQGPHCAVYHVVLPDLDCHVKHYRLADARAWLRACVRPAKARGEYDHCRAVAARGVPTVKPIAVGAAHGPGDSFLVTQTLGGARPLGAFIEQALPALDPGRQARLRLRLAVALGRFVARMHGAGVVHDDLHANNLLVALGDDDEPRLYLIDMHAVRVGAPLGWNASRDNLALLNRWFTLRAGRSDRLRFWRAYQEGRGQVTEDAARDLEERTWQSNLRFWAARDRRCLRANRYYRPVKSSAAAGHAVTDLDRAALAALLADPDEPFRRPGVVLLKDSRSSTVAEFDLPVNGRVRRVIWKRFRVTSCADPLLALLRPTAALRSWVNGHGLRERCLPTPRPLLVLHRRRHGLPREGYLLVEKVSDAEELARHVAGLAGLPEGERRPRLRALVEQVARLARELHRRQLSHRDLKAANVLVQRAESGSSLWLIDLVGVARRRRLSRRRRVQNLARLHASFHDHPLLTRSDRLRFLRSYLGWGLHGKQGWKDWWREIVLATRKKVLTNARNGRILA
jgi:tRNA A-37 threonylcarbamoyl transferase component Bud32